MLLLDLVVVRGHFPGKYVNRYLDSQQRIPKNIIAPPDGDSQISPRALSLSDADSQRFVSLVVSAFCFFQSLRFRVDDYQVLQQQQNNCHALGGPHTIIYCTVDEGALREKMATDRHATHTLTLTHYLQVRRFTISLHTCTHTHTRTRSKARTICARKRWNWLGRKGGANSHDWATKRRTRATMGARLRGRVSFDLHLMMCLVKKSLVFFAAAISIHLVDLDREELVWRPFVVLSSKRRRNDDNVTKMKKKKR